MGRFEISKNPGLLNNCLQKWPDLFRTQWCEWVGSIYTASWVICIPGKVPLMLNDKTGLGAASLASEMTSFSGGQDNAKPHSAHTTARLRGKSLAAKLVCLQSSLSRSIFTLVRDNKMNPRNYEKAKLTNRLQVCSVSAPLSDHFFKCMLTFVFMCLRTSACVDLLVVMVTEASLRG